MSLTARAVQNNLTDYLSYPEFFLVHAANYLINVGGGQMGVALRHLGGLMAQYFADGQKTGSVHGKVACCCVA